MDKNRKDQRKLSAREELNSIINLGLRISDEDFEKRYGISVDELQRLSKTGKYHDPKAAALSGLLGSGVVTGLAAAHHKILGEQKGMFRHVPKAAIAAGLLGIGAGLSKYRQAKERA